MMQLFKSPHKRLSLDSIRVSVKGVTISKLLYEKMSTPAYVEIFFDTAANRIGLKPQDKPGNYIYKVYKHGTSVASIAGHVSRHMPMGRYIMVQKKDNLFILEKLIETEES